MLPPPGLPPNPAYPLPPPPPGPVPPTPATRALDARSLGLVRLASIFGLVAGLVPLADLFLVSPTSIAHTTMTGTTTMVTFSIPARLYLIVALGTAFELVLLVLIRLAFAPLASVDPRFGTPATCALLGVIALPIIGVGSVLLFHSLAGASCTSGTVTSGCDFGPGFALGLGLIALGAIVGLIGIVGVLIGLWRLGDRYQESNFHLASILTILPLLDLVGWILILTSSSAALRRWGGPGGGGPPAGTF